MERNCSSYIIMLLIVALIAALPSAHCALVALRHPVPARRMSARAPLRQVTLQLPSRAELRAAANAARALAVVRAETAVKRAKEELRKERAWIGQFSRRVFPAPTTESPFGSRHLLGYLWPQHGAHVAKLRVLAALMLLLCAKLFIVRVPFIFKRCIDSLSVVDGTVPSLAAPMAWMLVYGFSRAMYTILQEARYLLFTPVAQNALRRFMRDAFAHVQTLDVGWLGSQSTGELSRVFARGVRGLNSLLRLLVFNVLPTALEALLVIVLLGRLYGGAFLLTSLFTIAAFVSWSLFVVEQRVSLLQVRLRSTSLPHAPWQSTFARLRTPTLAAACGSMRTAPGTAFGARRCALASPRWLCYATRAGSQR